jgi:hypothetical protein
MNGAIRTFVTAVSSDSGRICRDGAWTVIPFTSDAWTAEPVARVAWPLPPVQHCAAVRYTEAESLFRNQRDHRDALHQSECASSYAAALNAWEQQSASAAGLFLAALQTRPAFHGACTSLAALLTRESQAEAGRLTIVLTDGRETCRKNLPPLSPPNRAARLIIVLVSSTLAPAHDGVEEFEYIRAALLKSAPWSRVIPVWRLGEELKLVSRPSTVSQASPHVP